MWPAEGAMMNFTSILAELKSQRARIENAIAAIQSLSSPNSHRKTKPPESNASKRRRSRMSAAARRKLSLIMKKRWAQRKMKKRAA
jgi:hypothetical protein